MTKKRPAKTRTNRTIAALNAELLRAERKLHKRAQELEVYTDELDHDRQRLSREVLELFKKRDELKAAQQGDFTVSTLLHASGEPGFIRVATQVQVGNVVRNFAQEFHVVNLCQAVEFMAPNTIGAWQQSLGFAQEVLTQALLKRKVETTE